MMKILRELFSLFIPSSFVVVVVLLLLPLVESSDEQAKQVGRSIRKDSQKMSPELSHEVILHGFLLWASMGFLMPAGILLIRMSNTEKCKRRLKVLFYGHVILQAVSVLLSTVGAILSIKYFQNAFNNTHQRIGVALYGIIWVQALIGFCRPQRGSKGRSVWYFVHWVVGTGLSALGIINIYTGLLNYHKRTSRSISLWTILFTAEISFIAFLYLIQDKWDYMKKKQGVILGNGPIIPTDQQISPRDDQKELNAPC